MSKIHKLPQELINVIAAGEVVERPASVVKELMENAIDAGSTLIKVSLINYGKDLIEVSDNGIGMTEEDAALAFEQHATSKISTKEDLENILSLGFRGEALASISSVAKKTTLETKTENNDPVLVEINHGKRSSIKSQRSENGTKIGIYNLFENIPARKKFLKTDGTEYRSIVNTFIDIALLNIGIHFELYHNEKLVYRLAKANSIKDRVFDIWGNVTNNFYEERTVENNLCKIQLIIENPEKSRKNTNFQYIYVNGRRIDSKVISSAAKEAYQGFIHKDLKPSYLLVIHINPRIVDVNVHPRKLEVRFEDPQQIFRTVYSSIKKTLENETKSALTKTIEEVRQTNESFIADLTKTPSAFSNNQQKSYSSQPKFNKIQDAISFSKMISEPLENTYIPANQEIIQTKPINLHQYFNTYIVYEQGNEIVFIDQHAAAEKINFERLLYQIGETKTKPLLVPTVIDLKDYQKAEILENKGLLSDIGVIIDDFGSNSIQVSEIPEILKDFDFHKYVEEIINNKEDFSWLKTEYSEIKLSTEIYALLALTACHGSIRAGQKLTEPEMINIIEELKKLNQPNNCPHGRPISWKLKKTDIEKNFKRVI